MISLLRVYYTNYKPPSWQTLAPLTPSPPAWPQKSSNLGVTVQAAAISQTQAVVLVGASNIGCVAVFTYSFNSFQLLYVGYLSAYPNARNLTNGYGASVAVAQLNPTATKIQNSFNILIGAPNLPRPSGTHAIVVSIFFHQIFQ